MSAAELCAQRATLVQQLKEVDAKIVALTVRQVADEVANMTVADEDEGGDHEETAAIDASEMQIVVWEGTTGTPAPPPAQRKLGREAQVLFWKQNRALAKQHLVESGLMPIPEAHLSGRQKAQVCTNAVRALLGAWWRERYPTSADRLRYLEENQTPPISL